MHKVLYLMMPGMAPADEKGGIDMANHVVLVDDDPMNLKIANNILTKNGFEATTCHSGAELLEYL
jgi:ActR/RegA family two-component response regulator